MDESLETLGEMIDREIEKAMNRRIFHMEVPTHSGTSTADVPSRSGTKLEDPGSSDYDDDNDSSHTLQNDRDENIIAAETAAAYVVSVIQPVADAFLNVFTELFNKTLDRSLEPILFQQGDGRERHAGIRERFSGTGKRPSGDDEETSGSENVEDRKPKFETE